MRRTARRLLLAAVAVAARARRERGPDVQLVGNLRRGVCRRRAPGQPDRRCRRVRGLGQSRVQDGLRRGRRCRRSARGQRFGIGGVRFRVDADAMFGDLSARTDRLDPGTPG